MEDRTIPRQQITVVIELPSGRFINGKIPMDLDTRLSDFMNGPEKFFILFDIDGMMRIFNKSHIVEIREVEEK